jgi:hypothetical protein
MTPKVRHYLNKTILVSIPALFEDGKCRAGYLRNIHLMFDRPHQNHLRRRRAQ